MSAVTKQDAAMMVGLGRTAFYKHIKIKKISIRDDGKVDVSELIRVYGNENVKTLEERKKDREPRDADTRDTEAQIERLKSELDQTRAERIREREQYVDEIENLRKSLTASMEQNGKLTLLLTDKRSEDEKTNESSAKDRELRLAKLTEAVQQLVAAQRLPWWRRLGGR